MSENKLKFYLTKRQESIIVEHLINIKSSEDYMCWILDMLKNHILLCHKNMPSLKEAFEINEGDISNQPLPKNEDYKIEGATMKVFDLAGPVVIQSLEYCGKSQSVLNRKEGLGRKVFKSFEEYLNDVITDNVNALDTTNLGKQLLDEVVKTKQNLPKKIPQPSSKS